MKQWKGISLISINEVSREDIIDILERAKRLESLSKEKKEQLLKSIVVANLFFEPSTRTRLSFESAAVQLGARVIGFADPGSSSAVKGESLTDTIKMVENYADILVIRHPKEGAARLAADKTKKIVINAGDGANQHPTQTFLDLYTIKKSHKNITNLHVAIIGDLKYGRTVHSLAIALSHFNCQLYFVSPKMLGMPTSICEELEKKKVTFSYHNDIEEVIDKVDILYMTRIQKERFGDPLEYLRIKDSYVLREEMLKKAKQTMKILHPLPRVNEMERSIDQTKYAAYFDQAANGIPVRQAILTLVAGAKI